MALAFSTADPEITLEEESARKIIFKVEVPPDSRARTKDVGVTLTLIGKIMADTAQLGNAADSTAKIMEWSVVPAEKKEAYRSVTVKVKSGGITTRQYELPNAFIVDYHEDFESADGIGEFTLVLQQMKNKLADVKVTGGFSE
ncbi:MAG: membrane-associated protease 1 [Selenomonadaceae bacterium]|nr:membrane-associated protease 1 [Selenomonadaceae bacterium]